MSHTNTSVVRRFVYGTVLLLVPVLAVCFLGTAPCTLLGGNGLLDAQAFAPLSQPKTAPTVAKAANGEDVPEVKLHVWEYTAFRVSNAR